MPDTQPTRPAARAGGRSGRTSVRQLLGLSLAALAAVSLLAGLTPSSPLAWVAVVTAAVVFGLEPIGAVGRALDIVGGVLTAGIVCVLLLGTGGVDSVLQDVFVIILVYSAVRFTWGRLAVDTVVVGVAALVPGLLLGADRRFYVDLAADLTVWVAVAVLAGALARRMRAAAASSQRLRAVIDDVDDLVTVVDTRTRRILYANGAAATRVGRDRDELVGGRPWDFTDRLDEARFESLVAALDVGGPAVHVDHTSHREEEEQVFATSARLVAGEDGGSYLVSVARDVTAQRRAEGDARERAAMVEAADLAMIGTDLQGWVRSWNPAAERLYGIPEAEAIGRHVGDLTRGPTDDNIQGHGTFPVEHRYVRWSTRHHRRDGGVFDAEVAAWPISAGREWAPGVVLLVRDVTERRQAIEAIRRREERFRTLAEQASGVVYRLEFGPPQQVTFVGPRLAELLGEDSEAVLDQPMPLERVHPEDRPLFEASRPDHPRLSEGVHTYRVRHADGRWIWVEDHHRPELDRHGCVVATQGILFDVTARHELEEARQQALEHERELARRLEQTTIAQQTFLRSVSHELRTPLTSVRGFAHTLRDHRRRLDEDTTDQLLARLVANVDRLDDQLADLLDLDLLHEQRRRETWGEVDLRSAALAAVASLRAPGHTVDLQVTPTTVPGDRVRLVRAVSALVHNAVRHTPDGTTVTVWCEPAEDGVVLHVEDDGPGVDADITDRLFDPFVQGAAAAASPSPGAGVGLALVREVANLHGGSVRHRERPTGGSSFELYLPR